MNVFRGSVVNYLQKPEEDWEATNSRNLALCFSFSSLLPYSWPRTVRKQENKTNKKPHTSVTKKLILTTIKLIVSSGRSLTTVYKQRKILQ